MRRVGVVGEGVGAVGEGRPETWGWYRFKWRRLMSHRRGRGGHGECHELVAFG